MSFGNFLQLHGINYTLQRQNKPVREERGLPDKGYIMFRPGTDIVKSDVLTNPVGETYYVVWKASFPKGVLSDRARI